MVVLRIDNSTSKVSGLNSSQFQTLRDLLSYTVDAGKSYYQGGHRPSRRYLISARGEFPSGLLSQVQGFLTTVSHTVKDDRKRPEPRQGLHILNLGVSPYQEQIDAVAACVTSDGRALVSAATGFGKSILIACLVDAYQLPTLIVVPNLSLKAQLTESFKAWFGDTKHIVIENIDSPSLKSHTNYGLLIIDEAHHAAARTYRSLNVKAWKNIYNRICLTATPYRNKDEELLLMQSITGDVVYEVPYTKARDLGYVVPVESYFYTLPPTNTAAETWAGVYSTLVVKNEYRNRLIVHAMKALHAQAKSCLVLVKEVEHGRILSELTGAAFAHGTAEDTQELIGWFASGRLKSLIATEGVASEGCDTKACEYLIIAGLGKSKPSFMQKVGRSVRRFDGKESAKVILLRDKSHKWTEAHFKAQVKYLKDEFQTIPVQLPLPEDLV